MATLRRISRSNPLTNFSQAPVQTEGLFGVLAETMDAAYRTLEPIAIQNETAKGDALGRALANGRQYQPGVLDYQEPGFPTNEPAAPGEEAPSGVTTPEVAAGPIPTDAAQAALRTLPGGDAIRDGLYPAAAVDPDGLAGGGGQDGLAGGSGNDRLANGPIAQRLGINFAAKERQYNLPPGFLERTAQIESGGDPSARNPSSTASDLFQFLNSTASNYGVNNKDGNPVDDTDGAARLARDNAAQLRRVLGRPPTGAELYLAHQQGGGGASDLLRNPGARAVDVVGADAVRLNGGDASMTAGQFAGIWINKFNRDGGVSTTVSTQGGGGYVYQPPVVRAADGKLQQALYMPSSSPILQAHNAAAATAYNAEVLGQGAEEFVRMRQGYQGQPAEFAAAAQGFVDQLVKAAPESFRGALRGRLSGMAQDHILGAMSEQHDATQQRASNSTRALSDRYSTDYEDALVAGNDTAVSTARANLEEVLRVRESLPGSTWTRQQSENVLLDAARAAEGTRARSVNEQSREFGRQFDTIISAAEEGRTSEFDALLNDPDAVALQPEKAREAAAKVALRDEMPGFYRLNPAEQRSVIEAELNRPLGAVWEQDILDAAIEVNKATEGALEDDPIRWAGQYLDVPPPPMPEFTGENSAEIVSALQDRRAYGESLVDQGFVDKPVFFSAAEKQALEVALGASSPAELQGAVAGALAAGIGDAASGVFASLNAPIEVLHSGQMMAQGVSGLAAMEILQGREAIANGVAAAPTEPQMNAVISEKFGAAFVGLGPRARGDVTAAAASIYAARIGGAKVSPEDQAIAIEGAAQAAMGQTTSPRGITIGGVQDVMGKPTLLPPGVNGERATAAIIDALGEGSNFIADAFRFGAPEPFDWTGIAASEPMLGGVGLMAAGVERENLSVVPMGRAGQYRLVHTTIGMEQDVRDASGNLFVFSLPKLMEASR